MQVNNILKNTKIRSFFELYASAFVMVIFIAILGIINPKVISGQNITNILIQVVPIGILSLSVIFVFISGGIDLTAGNGIRLAAITSALVFKNTGNAFLSILLMFVAVLALGVTNGLLISKVKFNPVICTLAMMSVINGVVFIISQRTEEMVHMSHPFFVNLTRLNLAGIPVSFILMIFIYFLAWIFLKKTKTGFYLYCLGNNEEGARIAGIPIDFNKFIPYVISGFFMGLTGLVLVSKVQYITPTLGGTSMLLDAIAAAVIGGVSVSGGKGTVQGVLIGAFTIAIINNSINIIKLYPAWNDFFKGAIIVLMLLINRMIEKRSTSKG